MLGRQGSRLEATTPGVAHAQMCQAVDGLHAAGAASKRYAEDEFTEQLILDLAMAAGGAHLDKIHALKVQQGQFRYIPQLYCILVRRDRRENLPPLPLPPLFLLLTHGVDCAVARLHVGSRDARGTLP